jgi:hypothetical protein
MNSGQANKSPIPWKNVQSFLLNVAALFPKAWHKT